MSDGHLALTPPPRHIFHCLDSIGFSNGASGPSHGSLHSPVSGISQALGFGPPVSALSCFSPYSPARVSRVSHSESIQTSLAKNPFTL